MLYLGYCNENKKRTTYAYNIIVLQFTFIKQLFVYVSAIA